MVTQKLLVTVLAVQLALLALFLAALFGHAAWFRARSAWLRPRLRVVRNAAVEQLAWSQDPPALPRLPLESVVRVLAEATRSVEVAARDRLSSLPLYSLLLSRAHRWCRSAVWSRRLKGVRLLTLLGAGADTVPKLLDDKRPEVRSAAAAWVAHQPSIERTRRLVQMLDDDALPCRRVAQATLIRLGRRSLRLVTQNLLSPEPLALASTLVVAAELNDPSLLEPVLTHKDSPEPAVRAAVASVLASLGGGEAVETLGGFLDDEVAMVRAAAVTGIGLLGHWPSAPGLADRLGDPAWEVRHAAGLALRALGGPGRLYLQRARQAADPFASDMARQVLDLPDATALERQVS